MEYSGHRALVSCTCIFQPKEHHDVVEITYGCSESGFLCVFWCHSNLVVPVEPIDEGKHGISYCKVY